MFARLFATVAIGLVLGACEDPAPAPDWAWLEPTDWGGQLLGETPLAPWVIGGLDGVQHPGRVILYRAGCKQCGDHFRALANNPMPGALSLILVPEPQDEGPSARSEAPKHDHFELQRLPKGYGVPTPTVLLTNQAGRITDIRTQGE